MLSLPYTLVAVPTLVLTAMASVNGLGSVEPHLSQDPEQPVRHPLPSQEAISALPPDGGEEFNRLVFEKSPYLLQHARNPVDWYPWSEEAFRAAKTQNKPIFLSIGYSTCHWCHVMEHESFEDEDVARLLNDGFICIKLDREERPDLDHVYMTVTQAMNQGSGGWPMTVVMTPDKKPFFAGTYFPKSGRYGRWGMTDLLPRLTEAWSTQHEGLLRQADQVTAQLALLVKGVAGEELDSTTLDAAYAGLARRFDPGKGGFNTAPKFPVPHNLRFLLRYHRRNGQAHALDMVETTLREMCKGGVWDHVGFGFHRYSTDREWFVPHFEKMLYDQALLTMAYLEAWQVTGREEYAQTAREILTYVSRDLTAPGGGFFSAEDADSEGEEGLFYLWTEKQLADVLGAEDAEFAARWWGVTAEGNYHEEGTGKATGQNILFLDQDLREREAASGESQAANAERIEGIRRRLFTAREPRIHPFKDDKVLTDWNGLMIGAYAMAARVLDDAAYAEIAVRAGDNLLNVLRAEDGSLYKVARLGQSAGSGLLEDYAFASWGLLELFETSQELRFLKAARELVDYMLVEFEDADAGGFFLSSASGEQLIVRPKESTDGAIPSGNSMATLALLRLGRLTGEVKYETAAAKSLEGLSGSITRAPGSHTQFLMGLDFALGPTKEVVVTGDPADPKTQDALRRIHRPFVPSKVVILRPSSGYEALAKVVPYVELQGVVGEGPTLYLCQDFACQAPTGDVQSVVEALVGIVRSEEKTP
ncbi:MAG: thioredoxin domain-containing protein [Planctomycetota bacterium]|nr:thioredoxin domain-containing protein [Planctomycetota bacterium]